MEECDLSIIIVSFNTCELLLACLESVKQAAGDLDIEVSVVDYASTDGSADAIQQSFPNVRLVVNPENVGFTRAYNQI